MKRLLFLSIIFSTSACQLMTHRQFVDEMDMNDGIFTPNRDFKVVSGDSGNAYRSMSDIYERTPASEEERYRWETANNLSGEVRHLEDRQSDEGYEHYLKYRNRLNTPSEKIYFLNLEDYESREEYISSKGLSDYPDASFEEKQAVENSDILVGMSKDMVIKSWGRPDRVDVAGDPRYENERWAFKRRGQLHFIYFENGRVHGWTTE